LKYQLNSPAISAWFTLNPILIYLFQKLAPTHRTLLISETFENSKWTEKNQYVCSTDCHAFREYQEAKRAIDHPLSCVYMITQKARQASRALIFVAFAVAK
jgi:hypothetical protein